MMENKETSDKNIEQETMLQDIVYFTNYQLSKETLRGLKDGNFCEPTEIQRKTLDLALQGRDILGAAKTGSGKTLAFIIPVLECLQKEKWSQADGLGALVITPSRELAYQIFEVLKIVGQKHNFSAALTIGGKDLALERTRINKINIIICTPGRLLQHMNENPLFNCDNLKILVIDEADRILDMGFKKDMDAIIDFLPKERQCLLFSATQTSSIQDLARLSMNNYEVVTVDPPSATPEKLRQHYTMIKAEQKMSFLWSFLKRHKKSKILVFISTCKQTRFLHRLLSRMKPGISVNALYGTMHQLKRMDVYNKFYEVRHCALLATDVAARGLDFPDVDWVVQLDCPSDINSYIHRVGRTARADKSGRGLLVVMPNELDFVLKKMRAKKVPIEELETKEKHLIPIDTKVEATVVRDVELKEEAKRAFKCYLKSLLNSNSKEKFDMSNIDLKAYAKSLGLAVTPRVRILERQPKTSNQKPEKMKLVVKTKDNTFEVSSDDDDEELFRPARKKRMLSESENEDEPEVTELEKEKKKFARPVSKAKLAKKLLRKNIKVNKHIKFN